MYFNPDFRASKYDSVNVCDLSLALVQKLHPVTPPVTCAPQIIRTAGIFLGDVTENSEFALHNPCMACCVAMQTLRQPFYAVSVLFCLAQDALRFLPIGARSSAALKAENLFLRKQLALYVERKAKPRRASDAIRLTLVLLSRLFSWRDALVNVKPETFLRWRGNQELHDPIGIDLRCSRENDET